MHAAWVRFVSDGDPGWAPYDSSNRTTQVFRPGGSAPEDHPHAERLALWEGVR